MTIMFAGGITISGASFAMAPYMPEATADHGNNTTDGTLSVSSTHVMGGGIVGITINDPAIGATDSQIAPPSVNFNDQSIDLTQMTDGTWVAYVVDHQAAKDIMTTAGEGSSTAQRGGTGGIDYGILCDSGLGANDSSASNLETTSGEGNTDTEITDNSVYFQGVIKQHMDWTCTETNDAQTKGGGRVMISVLQDPPTVNSNSDIGTNNTGQRNMILNGTTPGLGAWPFIQAINFTATNDVEYGSESLEVSWGTSEYETDITVDRTIYPDNAVVHLTITDPGLNYDPTAQDIWVMDAAQETLYWYTNGSYATDEHTIANSNAANGNLGKTGNTSSNSVLSDAEVGFIGCGDNCILTVSGSPKNVLATNASLTQFAFSNVTMTETSDNSGVFESDGLMTTESDANVDSQMTFSYGGDSVTLIIGYHDAVATFDAGSSWLPVEDATYTITDPDMNRDSEETETLDIGDPYDHIPTIITGSPLTAADHVSTTAGKCAGNTPPQADSGVCISTGATAAADTVYYTVVASNTTDNSKRLMLNINGISEDAGERGEAGQMGEDRDNTITWLNVTTDIPPSDLVNLEGSVAIQYDISGIADKLASSDIDAYVMQESVGIVDGSPIEVRSMNGTAAIATKVISIVSSGNAASGIFDLDDTTGDTAGDANIDSAATQQVGTEGEADSWGTASKNNTDRKSTPH